MNLPQRLKKYVPQELQQLDQWVLWRAVSLQGGKVTKVPFQVSDPSKHASSTKRETWGSFKDALLKLDEGDVTGIGFVFSKDDPYVGVDLDHVRQDGVLSPKTWQLIERLNSYTELSPSGEGVHVICKSAELIESGYKGEGLEVYSHSRYFTVTGDVEPLFGDEACLVVNDATVVLGQILERAGVKSSSNNTGEMVEAGVYEELLNSYAPEGSRYEVSARVAGSILARLHPTLWDTIGKPIFLKWCDTHTTPSLLKEDPKEVEKTWENIKKLHVSSNPLKVSTVGRVEVEPVTDEQLADSVSEFSDLQNALRIIRDYGHEFKFANYGATGEWMRWDGKKWTNDLTVIDFFAQKLSVTLRREYAKEIAQLSENKKTDEIKFSFVEKAEVKEQNERLGKIKKFIISSESSGRIRALPSLLRPRLSVDGKIFDADIDRITVGNGILNLKTLELEPFEPRHFLTKVIPSNYDPQAQCWGWKNFIDDVTCGDWELNRYLQKLFGYCLTGSIAEQKMWFFYGPTSGNGKSTMMSVIKQVMGGDITATAPQKLLLETPYEEHPTLLMDVRGRRMIDISETPQKGKLNVNLLKQLTGGDEIKARAMRQDYVTFKAMAKFIFVTNYPPTIDDMTRAVWRRVRVVPFNASFLGAGEIKEYDKKLILERDGIFNWMVEGLRMYYAEGLEDCEQVKSATAGYSAEVDGLGAFVNDRCVVGPEWDTDFDFIYQGFVSYCEDYGVVEVGKKIFFRELKARYGVDDDRRGKENKRKLVGIRLRGASDE